MAFQRERHGVAIHAATIVGDFDQVGPARRQPHRDPGGPGIDRILHQFLERGSRAFHHFARCDTVDEMLGESSY